MTAPSTFVVTGTWTNPDGSAAAGTISFRPVPSRYANNGNVIDAKTVTVTLDGSGTLGAGVILVTCASLYKVTENLTGRPQNSYTIAGTTNISITPANPGTIVVKGVWYTSDGATGTGTINITQNSTGTAWGATLGPTGSIGTGGGGIVVPNDALGYTILEELTGAAPGASYLIGGTGSIDLSTAS